MIRELPAEDALERGQGYALWLEGPLLVVRVSGIITDAVAHAWVDATAAACERHRPRFCVVDVRDADSQSSLAARMYVARTLQRVLAQLEYGVGFAGESQGMGVVSRIVLRVVGVRNVSLITDEQALNVACERMRAGQHPKSAAAPPAA